MQLYLFLPNHQAQELKRTGSFGRGFVTHLGLRPRHGLEVSDSTRTDSFDPPACSWLVVIEADEQHLAEYEEPKGPILKALARLTRRREWLVPPETLEEHSRVVAVGDFAESSFASKWRTR